jgi:hypothetical protein
MALLVGVLSCERDVTAPSASTPAASRENVVAATGDNVVLVWDAALLQAVRTTHPGPTLVARDLAVMHTAIFDAWAAYDKTAVGTRLAGRLRRPVADRTDANKQVAVSYAAYRALADLFPTETHSFDIVMTQFGYDPTDHSTDVTSAVGIGNVAAQAVINFRHHDGANQLGDLHAGAYSDYTGYTSVNTPDQIIDPNRWQPLRVGTTVQRFTTPQWFEVIPFSLTSASQFRPPALPNQYPFGGYEKEVEQILKYSASLTDEQKMIAEYWADGPSSELPPGHWCLFGAFVSRRDHHSVDDDVKMFFALSNGLLDASIVAWDAKRIYDSVRPITAVHFLKSGKMIRAWGGPFKGVVEMRGELWQPYQPANVVTPPFPEFISGHSIFSAVSAAILEQFTGSDALSSSVTLAARSSRVEPGLVPASNVTLSWATFSDAADQAGLSRRYGGIHLVQGDLQSRAIGRLLGPQVWKKAQSYFDGTAD